MKFRNVVRQPKRGITGVRYDTKRKIFNCYITSQNGNRYQKSHADFFEACCWRKSMEHQLGYIQFDDVQKDEYKKQKKAEKDKRYYEKHREKLLAKQKDYYENNKDKVVEYRKLPEVKQKKRQQDRNYGMMNREKINEYQKTYQKTRRQNDTLFALTGSYRSLVRMGYKNKYSSDSTTQELLGCDWQTFYDHIKSLWEPWMNDDNYGQYIIGEERRWNIDHIISLASAQTEEERRKLFHYTNCRPYDALQNTSEGNRIKDTTIE